MPPKKVTAIPTNSIASVFATASKPKVVSTQKLAAVAESKEEITLSSLDAQIQAYYDTLKPNERIAHEIAVEKLGTSYDVSRTHGFVKWCKTQSST